MTKCFICFDDEGDVKSNVCGCKDRHVHLNCLEKWVNTKVSLKCEICLEDYNVEYEIINCDDNNDNNTTINFFNMLLEIISTISILILFINIISVCKK